jgi:GT2 family glycosyltransferase
MCLEALRRQSYRDFEIIVVNSSPDETTSQLVTSEFPEVRFHQSPVRLYPHAARNLAGEMAQGEILAFTDPDCIASADWLAHHVRLHDEGRPFVGGGMEVARREVWEYGVHLVKFFWALSSLPAGPHAIVPSANASCTRQVWEAVGPLDGDLFCGDAVLSWRASLHGYPPWFDPKAVVEHVHGGMIASLWREQFARGREFARVRAAFFHWSRIRLALQFPLLPFFVVFVLLRAGVRSFQAGWVVRYLASLPVQAFGQAAWCLGEALEYTRLAVTGLDREKDRRVPPR